MAAPDSSEPPPPLARQNDTINIEDLRLDRVVASSPEIGPSPPDGGYGWLILVAAFIYNMTIPTLLVAYGIIIVKANKEAEHDDDSVYRIWDVNIALVPVLFVVMRLLLESWWRAVVRVFHYPRLMALSGLCLTVAGVLLSSFATNTDDNELIINVFSGIFAGAGSALTGQQTEIILKHYFKDKLVMVQTIFRMGPSVGNCIIPIFTGFLCANFSNDVVLMIYGAVVMQNCFFLAAYTRPIYITKPLGKNYKILKDAEEDEDEDIFTKRNTPSESAQNSGLQDQNNTNAEPNAATEPAQSFGNNNSFENTEDNDEHVIATFNTTSTAREILQSSVQMRDVVRSNNENRFSNDFSYYNVNGYSTAGAQDLDRIERAEERPQPLYRETTVTNEDVDNGYAFAFDQNVTQGTARRTATLQRNYISLLSMLGDIDFYLYCLLHINTTYCILILGILLPPYMSEQLPSLNTFKISTMVTVTHTAAFCFIMFCVILPKSINKKARLCASFCVIGAVGFYGVSVAGHRSFLIIWGMFASFATASTAILQQPIYDDTLNEFDATATSFASNFLAAAFVMIWCNIINYEYRTCFQIASVLQTVTACVFIASSMRMKRRSF